ncbi:protein of unknown function [Stenotrophomonas maltophilia]|nr:protein of unknown function [Stenotrophomonas maltophilia]
MSGRISLEGARLLLKAVLTQPKLSHG